MHAFDAHKIVRLESPDDVFDHFIPARQSLYVERKEASARLLLTPESLDLLCACMCVRWTFGCVVELRPDSSVVVAYMPPTYCVR